MISLGPSRLRLPIAAVVVGLLSGLTACSRESRPAPPPEPAPTPVRVARAERTVQVITQPVAGTVRPLERALIAARISGTVAGASFAIGQRVARGEVLMSIQADELDARLEQARAAFEQATREEKREAALLVEGAAASESARAAHDRLRIAVAVLDEAKTLASYARITAPFAGIITRKAVNSGDSVSPGSPLLEIEAPDHMRVEADVPNTLPLLAIGTRVSVVTAAATIAGRVTETSPAADAVTRTRTAIVDLPRDSPVLSGDFVRVLWPAGESPFIQVPADAVHPFGQIERVFVVRDGRIELRVVRTGRREDDRVQVLSGLEGGEFVVRSAPPTLRDGQAVRIQP